ncbi:MAG: hypothetical protein ABI459_07320 [Deltaproteobacteria bacterium]
MIDADLLICFRAVSERAVKVESSSLSRAQIEAVSAVTGEAAKAANRQRIRRMAKAIFHKRFNYSRLKPDMGWAVKASAEPQSFPEDLVAAAVAAGCAKRVPKRRAKREPPADLKVD